jgi:hypothetical protein
MVVVPDNDNNSTDPEQEGGDDAEAKSRVDLPTEQGIREAFNQLMGFSPDKQKMLGFSLAKQLPKDLQDPMTGIGKDLRMQIDADNMNLELNVRMLFAIDTETERENLNDIMEAMLAIVHQHHYLTPQSKQKQNLEKRLARAINKIKKSILEFYPHLIKLMKALLAYHQMFAIDGINKENNPRAIIFREWMKVLGHLQSMHAVLSFAAHQGMLELDPFPKDFDEVIARSTKEREDIDKALMEAKQRISALQGKLLEEQQAIQAAQAPYRGISDQLASVRQNADSLAEKLHALTNPGAMARGNIEALKELEKN